MLIFALRKRCFFPNFSTAEDALWKELQQGQEYQENIDKCGFSTTLANAIMEHAYKHSPQNTSTRLATVCHTHRLPVPGDWAACEQEVNHIVQFHLNLHSEQDIFGDIGQPSYWTDHRKLFLYLGLLREGQDHS